MCPRLQGENMGLRRTDAYYCGEHMYGVAWERERQNGSYFVDRDISEEAKGVRGRLRWVTSWPLRAMVMSGFMT